MSVNFLFMCVKSLPGKINVVETVLFVSMFTSFNLKPNREGDGDDVG
jgi:hypothetical protein